MSTLPSLLIAFLLILLNGFFVGTEFALLKVRSTRLTELANEGRSAARLALHITQHFDVYLSATQLGISLASIALGQIAEPGVAHLMAPLFRAVHLPERMLHPVSFVVGLGILSTFHMVIGELVPKALALQGAERMALAVAYPLQVFYRLFQPAIFIINRLARLVLSLLHLKPADSHELAHSEEELRMILTASGESGVLKESEVDLVEHVFTFADKVASEVMVPRVDMVYMDATWPLERNLEVANTHTFTRYPLCEGDSDHVIGMIHVRDLLQWAYGPSQEGKPRDIRDVKWGIMFVPETKSIDRLLREFQLNKMHMAVVVDEYGGTAGILTLEDVIEQLVGEIYDEKEEPHPEVRQEGPDRLLVDGRVLLADLRAEYEIELPENESETVGGWMLDQLGAIPEPHDQVVIPAFRLEVEQMEGQRVRQVSITRLPAPVPEEADLLVD